MRRHLNRSERRFMAGGLLDSGFLKFSSVLATAIILCVGLLFPNQSRRSEAARPPGPVCSEPTTKLFGHSVAGECDIDGDLIADQIVGAPDFDCSGGRVYIFSGAPPHHILCVLHGEEDYDDFGFAVSSMGDCDGDGRADFIVGAPKYGENQGKVYVYSGRTLELLHTFQGEAGGDLFGFSVSNAGDVNDDGHDDIVVGAPGAENGKGRVYLYQGGTWIIHCIIYGEGDGEALGHSVSGAGDVNGDGFDDVIVGAPYFDGGFGPDNGRARVYGGSAVPGNCDMLCWGFGLQDGALFGWSVSDAGDVNNDGKVEFLVGAPGFDNGTGKAYVLKRVLGDPLCYVVANLDGEAPGDSFGLAVSNAGFINEDSQTDVVIGAPTANSKRGKAYVYFGDEWSSPARVISGEYTKDEFGFAVACAGDVSPRDGRSDVIIGAVYAISPSLRGPGKAYVYSCATGGCSPIYERTIYLPWPEITCPVDATVMCTATYDSVCWDSQYSALAPEIRWRWSLDGGETWSKDTTVPNNGKLYWFVPCMTSSDNCVIEVCANGVCEYSCDTSETFSIVPPPCFCGAIWGDLSNDGAVNPVDVVKIVNFVYKQLDQRVPPTGWACPRPLGDISCDNAVNPVDVVKYANYVYKGCYICFCTDPCG